jgi:RHS repeat-associated protein
VTYTYDGDGNRVMKSNGTIYWYGANSASLAETDLSGNIQRWYYFFDGQRVARQLPTNEVGFYMTDHLGNVRYLGGSATGYSIDYYPFGGIIVNSDTGDDRYQFTGKERDSESGLDNFGARYDSSSMGRFMSPDPSNAGASLDTPQSWNAYSYVLNNPLNYIDPSGMDCIHINNDTGKYEGFESGDCDNSTEEKANTGYYVDGTVNTIYTSTGDDQGVVGAYSGTNADSGTPTLISGSFAAPPPADTSDALNPFATAVFGDVFKRLRWMDPEVCGGGYFVLKGKGAETGVAHGGVYGMVTHDSRSGTSVGYLAEGGVGPVSAGHESSVNVSTGKVDSSNLMLAGVGDHLGAFAGYSNRNSPIQLGGYGEAFGRGGGAYVNVVPGSGCH